MKKAVAMITAATSVIVGMGSVSAFAIDQDFMEAFNRRVQYPSQEELAMLDTEIGAEQAYAVDAASSTQPEFYYAPYDSYSETNLADTTHYIAVLTANPRVNRTTPVPLKDGQEIYFYLNANLLQGNYASVSNIIPGYDYRNYVTADSSSVTTINEGCVQLAIKLSVTGNADTITDAVRYKVNLAPHSIKFIGKSDPEGLKSCESTLNEECSIDCNRFDTVISTETKGVLFTKCLYALGDLNRDGIIDSSDSSIMESFMVNLGAPNPSRSEKEQQCDVVAFGLAADCNQDNVVNILDAIYLNHHLADPGYYPL